MNDDHNDPDGIPEPLNQLLGNGGAPEAINQAENVPPHEDGSRARPRFPRLHRAAKIAALILAILSMAAYITGLLTLDRAKHSDRLQAEFDAKLRDLRADNDRLIAESARDRAELAALRLANADAHTMLRELYVASAASGVAGIEARQAAAWEHDLLGRYAEMRESITDDTRELCAAVHTTLARLDSLSPANEQAAKGLAESVREADLVARINAVLGSDKAPAVVRSWLLEAQIVLTDAPGE